MPLPSNCCVFGERKSMTQMMYIRFLSEGNVGHDLANPFETAYLICPECGASMILDRKTWTTECLGCLAVEMDIPAMFVNRMKGGRDVACISFEQCVPSTVNGYQNKPSENLLEETMLPGNQKKLQKRTCFSYISGTSQFYHPRLV